jgi:hypothetical protein
MELQQMDHGLTETSPYGIEYSASHAGDFLNDVRPVHVVPPLPIRDAAQQIGLAFRPLQDIVFVKIIGHRRMLP